MAYWCELLGLTPANGWEVSWQFVNDLRDREGNPLFGLNSVDGGAKKSDVLIDARRAAANPIEFQDTCAHEAVHCLGARMHALLEAGREVDAHEYLAEVLAPAMVKIRNTPRAKSFAKAVRQLPSRAKERSKMDATKLLLALCQGLMGVADLPPEAKALIEPVLAEASAAPDDATEVLPVEPVVPAAAAVAPLEPGYAKSVEVLFGARPDLTEKHRSYVKTHCKTVESAAEYIASIELPAPAPRAPQARPAAPLDEAPRGGANNTSSKLLSKKSDRLVVAKAMGQATEPKVGPAIIDKPGGGGRYFTLGSMTPKEYRAKRATGWDPRNEFPLASEAMQ
jgi:hypothetical protein